MKILRDKSIAIIGCADTKLVRRSGRTALSLAAQALEELLARTGLERKTIDGLAMTISLSEAGNPFWTNLTAEALGLSVSWSQITDIGGASPVGNVARAAATIHSGQCEMVVCLAADAPSSGDKSQKTGFRTEFADPFGYSGAPVVFGLLSSAYKHRFGLPERALAKLAVAQRQGALLNAHGCEELRVAITEEDYLQSRMIAAPIRLLDCVMRCDGANAVLVTSTQRAKAMGFRRLVHPVAYREITNFDADQDVDDITMTGFSVVGPAVLDDVGMKPSDVDMFHPYDDFFIAVLLQLEQIGFAARGGSGDWILSHNIGSKGTLPINTGGGQISAGQPGLAGGGVNLVEALNQLFGLAGDRQVQSARNALVTGIGAMQYARNWGTSAALMLEAG